MDHPGNSKKKTSVTFITTSFPRFQGDSAGSFVYKFAEGLAGKHCDVLVIAPHDARVESPEKWTGLKLHYCKYFPVEWQSLAFGAGIIGQIRQNPLRLFQAPFLLAALVVSSWRVRKQTDIYQTFWSPGAIAGLILKAIHEKPVVVWLAGSDIFFTRMVFLSTLFVKIMRRADAIVCENQSFKNQLIHIGIQTEKIRVIPNGINLDQFKPADKTHARKQLHLPQEKLLVLAIGSLSPLKGHEYLLEAIPEILHTTQDIEFLFIGVGDMRDKLTRLIQQLNLEKYVTFFNMQSSQNIPLWLNAADIFVLPSLSEGTPNVLLEAMACGLPCIATRVGGVPEVIQDGENGLLAVPKSPKNLAEKIATLIHNTSLRVQLGGNAHDSIRRNFASWESQSAALKQLYATVLDQSLSKDRISSP